MEKKDGVGKGKFLSLGEGREVAFPEPPCSKCLNVAVKAGLGLPGASLPLLLREAPRGRGHGWVSGQLFGDAVA